MSDKIMNLQTLSAPSLLTNFQQQKNGSNKLSSAEQLPLLHETRFCTSDGLLQDHIVSCFVDILKYLDFSLVQKNSSTKQGANINCRPNFS